MSAVYPPPPPPTDWPPAPPPGRQPGIKDYITSYLQGGVPGAMQMGGMQPPGWMTAIGNFLQKPEVNMALGMMSPLKGGRMVPGRQSIDVDLQDAVKNRARSLRELEDNKDIMPPEHYDALKQEVELTFEHERGSIDTDEFNRRMNELYK